MLNFTLILNLQLFKPPPCKCFEMLQEVPFGQLEKQGTGNGTGTGTETGTGNKNLHEAAGTETTRSSRLLSSRDPGTSRSKDSRQSNLVHE